MILAAVIVAFLPNVTSDSYSVTTSSYQTFLTNTETSFSNSTTYETYNSTGSSVLQSFVNPDWLGKAFVAVIIIFVGTGTVYVFLEFQKASKAKFGRPPAINFSLNCGKPLPPGSKFCIECGAKQDWN